jgi:hypothetical protein
MTIRFHGEHPEKDYSDGLTKQSFKDECNINKLLQRAQRSGTLSHLEKFEGMYGEMADFDMLEAQIRLRRGQEAFDRLPSEIRREFNQSPAEFFRFVNDPANKDDLAKKLPALAKPGRQNIDVSGKTDPTARDEPVAPPAAPAAPNSDPPAE